MIADLWHEAKSGDWTSAALLLMIAAVAGLVLLMSFYFADSSFLPERNMPASVIGKHYTPGHMQTQVISNGKTTMIQNIWIPDSWSVEVFVHTESVSCPVNEGQFNGVSRGDEVTALVVTGRFSGGTYCNGIRSI